MKESTELLSASFTAVISTTSKMLLDQKASPELKEMRGQLERLDQGLQTTNAAVEELKEEVRNMSTMLKEMKEIVSLNSLIEWKKQEKKEKQEAAKRPRPDKTPESNKKQRQEAGKAASKK